MKLTFFFNYLNHHQVLVADEMYKKLKDNFCFVATFPRDFSQLKGGQDYSDRPYCIMAVESNEKAHKLNLDSEVCVYGAGNLSWMKERSSTGKLSFEVSERWLKRGWVNIFSPRLVKWLCLYKTHLESQPFYKLCCSAFAAYDDNKLGCYKGRHFKWGYFTAVNENLADETFKQDVSILESTTLMWCARFLKLKHPELPIQMAAILKSKGYKFQLDMYGNGEELEATKKLATELDVNDLVSFKGNLPNAEILSEMRKHEIFLFTSDKNEGWGAVANESMANGCTLVASDAIGSSPYLIKDGYNGFKFESCNVNSLVSKVIWLLEHPKERLGMRRNAFTIMSNIWSPKFAAVSLLQLIDDLHNGRESSIKEGPCSLA